MRTTVQLRDDQHRRLAALAIARGEKGFSTILQDAVDRYLDEFSDDDAFARDMLDAYGMIDDEQAAEMKADIQLRRRQWRTD